MITEGLNCTTHSKGCHGYGSLLRGCNNNGYSFHHNLYAHHDSRSPRPGNYVHSDPCGLLLDFRNNVIYNWGGNYAGNNQDGINPTELNTVTRINFVNNYYIAGPNTTNNYAFWETTKTARGYFSGNWMNGSNPSDPWSLVYFYNGTYPWTGAELAVYKQSGPIPIEPNRQITNEDAVTAYSRVLEQVGTSLYRDSVDNRVINDVINGTGKIIDHEEQVGGWPVLNSTTPPVDSDHDGMPDEWELAVCLNPNDANDRNGDRDSDGYTNLEEYLNWLVSGEPMPANTDTNCDGTVNFLDFANFAKHWYTLSGSELYNGRFDYNHNNVISLSDLYYITQDWLLTGQEY
jgi:hypothetical protein